jgi:C1A family cysteine protease
MYIFDNFDSEKMRTTGILELPTPTSSLMGGHAVVIVGYDNVKKCFKIRNSWGSSWGLSGSFYVPYEFMLNPNWADDFWVISNVLTNKP